MRDMLPNNVQPSIRGLLSSKKIVVLGPSGSGKTYLALRLSKLLSRELIHLDAHFWKPGWISTPQAEWRETVSRLVRSESWIMDGTYESTLDLRLPAADAVILMNDWSFLRLYRVLIRRFGGGDKTRADAPPGQKLDIDYLRYIFFFSKISGSIIANQLSRHGAGKVLMTLSGQRDVDRLLKQIEALIRREGEKD